MNKLPNERLTRDQFFDVKEYDAEKTRVILDALVTSVVTLLPGVRVDLTIIGGVRLYKGDDTKGIFLFKDFAAAAMIAPEYIKKKYKGYFVWNKGVE